MLCQQRESQNSMSSGMCCKHHNILKTVFVSVENYNVWRLKGLLIRDRALEGPLVCKNEEQGYEGTQV